MSPITALLIDPRTAPKVTARQIQFSPDLETFYRLLDCELIGGFTLHSGHSLTYVDEPIEQFQDPNSGGLFCVWNQEWEAPVFGPIIITGPIDDEGEHTSLSETECLLLASSFFTGWVCPGRSGPVKIVTRITHLTAPSFPTPQ